MKKPAKIIVASTLGAALLLGGSTYALWTSSSSSNPNATIQIGSSDLTKLDDGVWVAVAPDAATASPTVLDDVSAFRAAPGDVLTFEQNYRLDISGNSGTTLFSVDFPEDSEVDVAALAARGFTLTTTVLDDEGTVLATSTADDLSASFELEGATPTEGSLYTIRFEYKIDSAVSAEDTKNLATTISSAVVSANQLD